MSLFTGSGVALVTPFTSTGVDFAGLKALLEYHLQAKTDAIIVCGTTGEASTMSKAEKQAVIAFTTEVIAGRIPVIAGTGGNNTSEVIELSQYAESVGVDGLLCVTPYYNRTTQSGLIAHYQAIADSVQLPIIIYNVPQRTGVNVEPETLYRLSQIPNIVGIKEASGNIAQVAKMARLVGPNFAIYSGNDDMIVPTLSLGGKGVISVVANICPQDTHYMVACYLEGKVEQARELQLKMLDLINALFIENNPIPIKTAMQLLGFPVGNLRLPLVEMDPKHQAILVKALKDYGFTLKE